MDDCLLFGNGARQWFFTVNVLLAIGSLDGHQRVPVIGNGEHDGVNVRAGHHFAIIVVRFAILVLVMAVDGLEGGIIVLEEATFIQIACGYDLAFRDAEKMLGVARPLHPPTHDAHHHLFRWSNMAPASKRLGRDERGKSERCPGGGEEVTAGDFGIGGGFFHNLLQYVTIRPSYWPRMTRDETWTSLLSRYSADD